MTHTVVAALIACGAALAAAFLGLTQALGAHPFWSTEVVWIGAPVGLGVAWLFMITPLPRKASVALGLVGAIVAYGVAQYGKSAFAASFAENQFAGKLWYFGWIATAAMFTATAVVGLSRSIRE